MVLNGQCDEDAQFHDAIYPIDAVTFRGECQIPSGQQLCEVGFSRLRFS
jgi:hypothetical protein